MLCVTFWERGHDLRPSPEHERSMPVRRLHESGRVNNPAALCNGRGEAPVKSKSDTQPPERTPCGAGVEKPFDVVATVSSKELVCSLACKGHLHVIGHGFAED